MALTVDEKSALSGSNSSWVKQPAISAIDEGLVPWTISLPLKRASTGTQVALTVPFTGKLVSIQGFVAIVGTGTSASIAIQPKNGSTSVTGGNVTVVLADTTPEGAAITFAAITAANSFVTGDTLNIVFTVGTAFTAGVLSVVMFWSGTGGSNVVQALRETRIITDSDN